MKSYLWPSNLQAYVLKPFSWGYVNISHHLLAANSCLDLFAGHSTEYFINFFWSSHRIFQIG